MDDTTKVENAWTAEITDIEKTGYERMKLERKSLKKLGLAIAFYVGTMGIMALVL